MGCCISSSTIQTPHYWRIFVQLHCILYYYNRNIEVDFYVPDEGLAVQASYQMSDEETIEREVKALVTLHGLYPLKRAMIITYEDEGEIVRDGLKIEIRPAWKWVLEG